MLGPKGEPLKREYVGASSGSELDESATTRGFETAKGKYVTVSEEELERLAPEKSRDIDLRLFVAREEVSPVYFERAYFLTPADKSGKAYRLLSEAEWEYCCRAGTTTTFWWGESITGQGNFEGKTLPVDSFKPNPWGLYQGHCNVREWCEDNWHENYQGAPQDGSVWVGGNPSWRVLRGGTWGQFIYGSGCRNAHSFGDRLRFVGLRVARTL